MAKYRFNKGDYAYREGKLVKIVNRHKNLYVPFFENFRFRIENYYDVRYLPSEEFGMVNVPEEDLIHARRPEG